MSNNNSDDNYKLHLLKHKWNLYTHLPHDIDWSIKSYKHIITLSSIEQTISLFDILPDKIIKNCMLFIMKQNVLPIWEDKLNKNGGSFSFKVYNNNVVSIWRNLVYMLLGDTLMKKNINNLTGISISPKKNFCIIKIWCSDCSNQNPLTINYFEGLTHEGCLFKKHLSN